MLVNLKGRSTLRSYRYIPPLLFSIDVNANSGYAYTSGTSITNDITYNVYTFTSSTNTPSTSTSSTDTYTINYNCNYSNICYILAVGGGGAGGGGSGGAISGGGGGGGVVMIPIILPKNSTSITISIGNGSNAASKKGYNTYVNFNSISNPSIENIVAYGGGYGGMDDRNNNVFDASSGGSGGGNVPSKTNGGGNNNDYNFANYGGFTESNYVCGAGGGAGSTGNIMGNGSINAGIVCNLPGIKDYKPSETSYGTYYWGGGGGQSNLSTSGKGGFGGGGGGGRRSNGTGGSGGLYGINNGYDGGTSIYENGGNGGVNTGGGGGGAGMYVTATCGNGGSGFVAIAFPTTQQSILLQNYNFASPSIPTNSVSTATPTNWTKTGPYFILNGTGGDGIAMNNCPYKQFIYTISSSAFTLSQNITLSAKTYTLTFAAAVSTYEFVPGRKFTITYNNQTYTSTLTSANVFWNVYSWTFTNPSSGTNLLSIEFNGPGIGITQILIF
jgi:hypothetical protein